MESSAQEHAIKIISRYLRQVGNPGHNFGPDEYRVIGRRSLKDLEMRLRRHLLPAFGNQRAAAITTAAVNGFIVERQAVGARKEEINRELSALKRAFSLAVKRGKLLTRPYIPMLKENNVRRGFFERQDFEGILKHLDADLRQMITFAYITGWRIPSEVLMLQLRQVDFTAGRVRLDPGTTKNNERREFAFAAELREILEAQRTIAETLRRQGKMCPWVFHRGGQPIRTYRRSWNCPDSLVTWTYDRLIVEVVHSLIPKIDGVAGS